MVLPFSFPPYTPSRTLSPPIHPCQDPGSSSSSLPHTPQPGPRIFLPLSSIHPARTQHLHPHHPLYDHPIRTQGVCVTCPHLSRSSNQGAARVHPPHPFLTSSSNQGTACVHNLPTSPLHPIRAQGVCIHPTHFSPPYPIRAHCVRISSPPFPFIQSGHCVCT